MVVSGSVRVEKGPRADLPAAVVNVLEEGHTFGEMSFMDNTVPCASCIADTDNVKVRAARFRALCVRLAAAERVAGAGARARAGDQAVEEGARRGAGEGPGDVCDVLPPDGDQRDAAAADGVEGERRHRRGAARRAA